MTLDVAWTQNNKLTPLSSKRRYRQVKLVDATRSLGSPVENAARVNVFVITYLRAEPEL